MEFKWYHFILLWVVFLTVSPGLLITVPKTPKGYFMTIETSRMAVIAHSVLYVILVAILFWFMQKF